MVSYNKKNPITTLCRFYQSRGNNLKTSVFVFALIAALVVCLPALAQGSNPPTSGPLILTDDQGKYPLGRYMDILEDPSGELTIEDVSSPPFDSRFTRSQMDTPNFGYTDSAIWVRLNLDNNTVLTHNWLLEIGYPNTHFVDLYTPLPDGGGFTVKESGVLRPPETRDLRYPRIIFSLALSTKDPQMFYLRFKNGASMTLPLILWDQKTFINDSLPRDFLLALFYGVILGLLIYNSFLLFSLREMSYLYLVLALASFILYFSSYDGYSEIILFPNFYYLKVYYHAQLFILMLIWMILFADTTLELKTRLNLFHRIAMLLTFIGGILILLGQIVSYHILTTPATAWSILVSLTLLVEGMVLLRRGYSPARFYIIAWFGILSGLILALLVRAGLIPSNFVTENSFRLGLVWMAVGWSIVLGDRINLLKAETDGANRSLRNSERRLSQTLEGMPLGVVVYGPDRRPSYVNPRAISILSNPEKGIAPGVSGHRTIREAIKYFSFRQAGSGQEYPADKFPVWQAFEGKPSSADDVESDLIDRRVPLEIWANPILDEHGRVESVVVAFQDITQRKQVEARLVKSKNQLERSVAERTAQLSSANEQLLAENAERQRLEAILFVRLEWLAVVNQVNQVVAHGQDLPQTYQKFTDIIKDLFGATDAFIAELDLVSKKLTLLAHSCKKDAHPDLTGLVTVLPPAVLSDRLFEPAKPELFPAEQFQSLGGPLGDHFHWTKSQTFALVPLQSQENHIGLIGLEFLEIERRFSADEINLIEKICFDITQVREKAILMDQSEALIAAEERNRLAQDLHDSVTQVLFAASLVAETLPQIWRRDPNLALHSLDDLHRLTRGALAEMRTMLVELRPAAIFKTPLHDLLAQLTEAVIGRTRLTFQLFLEPIPPLPEDVHICFYRIAQESLNNVVKHAQASLVKVNLSATPLASGPNEDRLSEVKLVVQDDGRGFKIQEEKTHHLGIAIMRERAADIHADFILESQPGRGTTVILTWHK